MHHLSITVIRDPDLNQSCPARRQIEDAKPRRADFLPIVTAGWTLKTIMDSSEQLRNEMYAVRNAQAPDLVLQMNSSQDGLVVSATLLGTR